MFSSGSSGSGCTLYTVVRCARCTRFLGRQSSSSSATVAECGDRISTFTLGLRTAHGELTLPAPPASHLLTAGGTLGGQLNVYPRDFITWQYDSAVPANTTRATDATSSAVDVVAALDDLSSSVTVGGGASGDRLARGGPDHGAGGGGLGGGGDGASGGGEDAGTGGGDGQLG